MSSDFEFSIPSNISLDAPSDIFARILLAFYLSFCRSSEVKPWHSLVISYPLSQEEGNQKIEDLRVSIRSLASTMILHDDYSVQLFKAVQVSTQNGWKIFKVSPEPDAMDLMEPNVNYDRLLPLLWKLTEYSSNLKLGFTEHLYRKLRQSGLDVDISAQFSKVVPHTTKKPLPKNFVNITMLWDRGPARVVRPDNNEIRTLSATKGCKVRLSASRFFPAPTCYYTPLADPYARALQAFILHCKEHSLVGFSIYLHPNTASWSNWSDNNIPYLESICRQVIETSKTEIRQNYVRTQPISGTLEVTTSPWRASFKFDDPSYQDGELNHWYLMGQILGTREAKNGPHFVTQVQKQFRKYFWALEDEFGIEISVNGSFLWDGDISPVLDRNKPLKVWSHHPTELLGEIELNKRLKEENDS